MSTIPYKQLKDENGESFYPVCGESSFSGAVPIEKGGTGANNAAEARTNLGLGATSVEDVLPVAKGGTGASTAADARTNLGITVYHKLVLGTTSAAGNLVLDLNTTDHILIAAAINRQTEGYRTTFYNIMPCGADIDGNLFVTAFQPGMSATTTITSTAIAVDVWYILNNSVDVT